MSVLGPGAVRDLLVVSQTVMYRVPISWGNDTIATNKKIETCVQDVTDDIYIIFISRFLTFLAFWGLPILMDYNRVNSIQYTLHFNLQSVHFKGRFV